MNTANTNFSAAPTGCQDYIRKLDDLYSNSSSNELETKLFELINENRDIHEMSCINLNPATNIMNPKAEALLSSGLGSRPSLGYPGDKYEMGLEAIEKIEIMATALAREIFSASYAEIRLGSGALANLYAFMAVAKAGNTIIAPPAEIGGHVTHHMMGAAGLYGLNTLPAPYDPENYTIDIDQLRKLAHKTKPKLITVGGSLNLFPHPVGDIRSIADEVGCYVHFDAAHLCGMFAGKAWRNPLDEGAHMMSMSTYKSLGGPPSGLLLTTDKDLGEKIDKIAFPGLTANFDVAKSAALAMTLLDWREFGKDYAAMMIKTAQALAKALADKGLPVFKTAQGYTGSHQFALMSEKYGGGQNMAKVLRKANILSCGIGLPIKEVPGDTNGLRLGTPETVRFGMQEKDMIPVADFIYRALEKKTELTELAKEVTQFRSKFQDLNFIRK